MIRFLIERPIAVLTSFVVLAVFGVLAMFRIPVSLLPDVSVPRIIVKVDYPNSPAEIIDQNVTQILRENFQTMHGLIDIETRSTNHAAMLFLTFDFGANMSIRYIETNELLDRAMNSLPRDLTRPDVIRISASDIPAVRLQVTSAIREEHHRISELTEKVIKKRIEQLDGVSLVDINGAEYQYIVVSLNLPLLHSLGIDESVVSEAIQSSNSELGALSVKDGQYRYFVTVTNRITDLEELRAVQVPHASGRTVALGQIASVEYRPTDALGSHLYNGKQGIVVAIHKQAHSRMNEMMANVQRAVAQFELDYPDIDFALTQDQTFLLNSGLQNLVQAIIFGSMFCVLLLFLFIGSYESPILMGISIPISLLYTFVFFYLFDISFNIISLSGLALGVGKLIDNSIIVIDSITRKRSDGLDIDDSCVAGTNEVALIVVSQVLTTVAIYLPLVYMSGLAGALVYDQAIALSISLGVSLLVALILTPLLYKLLNRNKQANLKEGTPLFSFLKRRYHSLMHFAFARRKFFLTIMPLIMVMGLVLIKSLPINTLPYIEETETSVTVDWNQPVTPEENSLRISMLAAALNKVKEWEAETGLQQFLFQSRHNDTQEAQLYYRCDNSADKNSMDSLVRQWLATNHPMATFSIGNAPNAFTQLFENEGPYFEIRVTPYSGMVWDSFRDSVQGLSQYMASLGLNQGLGFLSEPFVALTLNSEKMLTYNVSRATVENALRQHFGVLVVSEVKRFGEVQSINLSNSDGTIEQKLNHMVVNESGSPYPLNEFVSYRYVTEPKYVTSDKGGRYLSFHTNDEERTDFETVAEQVSRLTSSNGLPTTFKGYYFEDRVLMKNLSIIFIISVLLLYFILVIQFENLIHPLLVLVSLPLGIFGAALVLWLANGTLNIMSAIGFILALGIVADDPILKISTINRLRKEYKPAKMASSKATLRKIIDQAGEVCLKPVLLTCLTTCLALAPILFMHGIGSDLQKPLVYIVCGGLILGTFLVLIFVPLAYWAITKKEENNDYDEENQTSHNV